MQSGCIDTGVFRGEAETDLSRGTREGSCLMESSVSREFWGSLSTCRLGMLRRILHKDVSFRRYAPLRVSSRSWFSGPAAANASAAESVRPRPQNVSSSLSNLCNNRAKHLTMHCRWCNAHAAAETLEPEDHTKGSLQTTATQRLGSRMRACTPRMHDAQFGWAGSKPGSTRRGETR